MCGWAAGAGCRERAWRCARCPGRGACDAANPLQHARWVSLFLSLNSFLFMQRCRVGGGSRARVRTHPNSHFSRACARACVRGVSRRTFPPPLFSFCSVCPPFFHFSPFFMPAPVLSTPPLFFQFHVRARACAAGTTMTITLKKHTVSFCKFERAFSLFLFLSAHAGVGGRGAWRSEKARVGARPSSFRSKLSLFALFALSSLSSLSLSLSHTHQSCTGAGPISAGRSSLVAGCKIESAPVS